MVKKLPTCGEEFVACFDSADQVFEFCGMSLDDVDEVFFHLLDVFFFDIAGDFFGGFFVESLDVGEDHFSGDGGDGLVGEGGAELGENPGVSDGSAPDHESGGLGGLEVSESGLAVYDVAIGDDGAEHFIDGAADCLVVNGGLVAFFDSAAVDREEVDGVFFKDGEEGFEFVFRFEADTGFDGEGDLAAGFAKSA